MRRINVYAKLPVAGKICEQLSIHTKTLKHNVKQYKTCFITVSYFVFVIVIIMLDVDTSTGNNYATLYMIVSASSLLIAAAAIAGIIGLICRLKLKRHQLGGIYFSCKLLILIDLLKEYNL